MEVLFLAAFFVYLLPPARCLLRSQQLNQGKHWKTVEARKETYAGILAKLHLTVAPESKAFSPTGAANSAKLL